MNHDHPVVLRLKAIVDAEIITLQQLWHMPLSDIRANYLPDIIEKMEVSANDIHVAINIVEDLVKQQNARLNKNAGATFKLAITTYNTMLLASDDWKSTNYKFLDDLRGLIAANAAIEPDQVEEYCKSYILDQMALRTVIAMNMDFDELSGLYTSLTGIVQSETGSFRGEAHTINTYI